MSELPVESVFSIGGQLLDLLRRVGTIAVVEVIAEEVLVVAVVPVVGLLGLLRLLGLGLLRRGGGVGLLQVLGRDLLEQRVLDHLLVEQVGQLQRRHRQQLDRLLQRWRQNELLNELGVKFLRNRHERLRMSASNLEPILVQPEIGPEINSPHVVVGRQLVRRAAAEDAAVVHDVRAVGDAQRLAHVVVGDEHADPPLLQVEDDLLDVGDGDRVDAGERLVEQDELGRDDQRPGDLGAPALAARERVGRRRRQVQQVQLGEQLPRALPPLAPR